MTRKILCYPDNGEIWNFTIKGGRCRKCGSNCFHYMSINGNIAAYCNACGKLIGYPTDEREKELRTGLWKNYKGGN